MLKSFPALSHFSKSAVLAPWPLGLVHWAIATPCLNSDTMYIYDSFRYPIYGKTLPCKFYAFTQTHHGIPDPALVLFSHASFHKATKSSGTDQASGSFIRLQRKHKKGLQTYWIYIINVHMWCDVVCTCEIIWFGVLQKVQSYEMI